MNRLLKLTVPYYRLLDDAPEADGLVGEFDDMIDDSPEEPVEAPVEEEAAPPAEEAAPAEEPEAEAPAEPEEPVVDDPVPEVETPQPVVEQPVEQPKEEEAPKEDPAKAQADYLAKMQEAYSITQEEADSLLAEPEVALPKFAANMHMRIMADVAKAVSEGMGQMIQQHLLSNPALVQQALSQAESTQQTQTNFYTKFPALKEHQGAVAQVAAMVEKQFASLSREEQINKVGEVAYAMLGLQQQQEPPAPAPQPPAEPFIPNRGGSGGRPSAPSEWDELIID